MGSTSRVPHAPPATALLCLWAALGCGEGDHHGDGACGGDDDSSGEAGGDLEWDTYAAGMSRTGEGGVFEFVLVAADPGPPDKGENTWTLELREAGGGAVVEGATVEVVPYMPLHGHGTQPASYPCAPAAEAGSCVAGPFDLFMAGTWEVAVNATGPDGATDQATFTFCLEG